MTKEDILINVYADTWMPEYKDRNEAIEHVKEVILKDSDGIKFATASYKTMDQFAKQTAVSFAEWVRYAGVFNSTHKKWEYATGIYSTEELYELYLKSLEA